MGPVLQKNRGDNILKTILSAILIALFLAGMLPLSFAKTDQNTAYTGYQVTGPYTTLRVAGSWIVPTANCTTTPNSQSDIFVQFDSIKTEGDGFAIGTYQNCINGVASYGAFVHISPMTNFFGNQTSLNKLVIRPGDVIEAQGTWRSPATPIDWNTNFVDETTCKQIDTDAHSPAGFVPKQNSGALLLNSNNKTLTSLSTIQSGKEYTASVTCSGSGIQGTKYDDIVGPEHVSNSFGVQAALPGFTLVTWTMPGTSISPLTDSGSSFTIS